MTNKLEHCECLTLDENLAINDAILYGHSALYHEKEKLDIENAEGKIETEIYENIENYLKDKHKRLNDLAIKIDNTPICR